MADYLIVLIHGTWAGKTGRLPFIPEADYVANKEHSLRKILKEKILEHEPAANVDFIEGWWHSRNRQNCREDGAKKISKEIKAELEKEKYKNKKPKVFLVAHSHGCEVSYQIISQENLQDKIDGIIAINSPNFIILRRDFFRNIEPKIKYLKYLLYALSFAYIICILWSIMLFDWQSSFPEIYGRHILMITLLFGGGSYLIRRLEGFSKDSVLANQEIEKIKTTNCPVLCTNSSGDEAWNILNLFSSLSQSPFYLTHKIPLAIIYFITFLILFICLIIDYNIIIFPLEKFPFFGDLLNSIAELNNAGVVRKGLFALYMCFVIPLLVVSSVSIFAFVTGYILSYIYESLGVGNSWLPGASKFMLTRTVVSVLPVHVGHIQFIDTAAGSGDLTHSRVYNDDWAIERMSEWLLTGRADISVPREGE